MSYKFEDDPTRNGKYSGTGVRIKAENLLKLELAGKGTLPAILICYVSKGGKNIARIYSNPNDADTKVKELKDEGRYHVVYGLTIIELLRNEIDIPLDSDGGTFIARGTGSLN